MTLTDKITLWLVWHLPRRIVYWATIRLFAHGTTGQYDSTIVTDLEVGEALKRWDA